MRSVAELRVVAQAGKDTDPGWYRVHRRLSIHVTRVALALRLQADQVSLLMMASTLGAALLIASGSVWLNIVGFGLGYVGFLLDKVDGEVARLTGRSTMRGILLDRLHHRLVEPALLLGVAWHEFQWTGSPGFLVAGFAAMLLGGAIDENQHLSSVILHKHLRQGGSAPRPRAPAPPSTLARLHRALRPLKAARTVALSLPIAAIAYALERIVRQPVPGWWLEVGALSLGAFLILQIIYFWYEGLEREVAEVVGVMQRSLDRVPSPRARVTELEAGGSGVVPELEREPETDPAEIEKRWAT